MTPEDAWLRSKAARIVLTPEQKPGFDALLAELDLAMEKEQYQGRWYFDLNDFFHRRVENETTRALLTGRIYIPLPHEPALLALAERLGRQGYTITLWPAGFYLCPTFVVSWFLAGDKELAQPFRVDTPSRFERDVGEG